MQPLAHPTIMGEFTGLPATHSLQPVGNVERSHMYTNMRVVFVGREERTRIRPGEERWKGRGGQHRLPFVLQHSLAMVAFDCRTVVEGLR